MFLTDECDVNIMITKNDYSDNKQPLNCRFIEDVFTGNEKVEVYIALTANLNKRECWRD